MFDFIVSPGATINVTVSPDADMRAQLDRIEKALLRIPIDLAERIAAMTAELQRLSREVQETKDSNALLVGKIGGLITSNRDLAQQIKDAAQDSAEVTRLGDVLDQQQTDNAAFLASLSTASVPLTATYPDRATFDAAVGKYSGQRVTLDAVDVKAGTEPALDYFTHSADGHIDTTGPTD